MPNISKSVNVKTIKQDSKCFVLVDDKYNVCSSIDNKFIDKTYQHNFLVIYSQHPNVYDTSLFLYYYYTFKKHLLEGYILASIQSSRRCDSSFRYQVSLLIAVQQCFDDTVSSPELDLTPTRDRLPYHLYTTRPTGAQFIKTLFSCEDIRHRSEHYFLCRFNLRLKLFLFSKL